MTAVYLAVALAIKSNHLLKHQAMPKAITLKQKIGQMILVGFNGLEILPTDLIVKSILSQNIGGVILFDYNFQTHLANRNIQSPAQVKALTQQLQIYANQAAITNQNELSRLIISIDYEGGKVNRLKEAYGFPPTKSAAAIGRCSFEDAKREAEQMVATLQAVGINLNFAPVLDVNVNSDNPVIGKLERSYSSDPKKVTDYARIFAKAHNDVGVSCAFKHFPGHGSSKEDTHTSSFVDVTDSWKEYELDPYKALLKNADECPVVMTAHVINKKYDSYPASISALVTTGLLRNTLKFEGVVVTDDMQMDAIKVKYGLAEAVKLAVNAGADILVFGNQLVTVPQDPQEIVDIIYDAIEAREITVGRIDESFERILRLKKLLI